VTQLIAQQGETRLSCGCPPFVRICSASRMRGSSGSEAKSGTCLRWQIGSAPADLNPVLGNSIFDPAYEPLIELGRNNSERPGLATSGGVCGSDLKVFDLTLRSGAKFVMGRPSTQMLWSVTSTTSKRNTNSSV